MVVGVQLVVVDEVGAVSVDERVEAQAVPPARAEVLNVNSGIPEAKRRRNCKAIGGWFLKTGRKRRCTEPTSLSFLEEAN